MLEGARQARAAGDAGDGTAETMDSSEGGAVDGSSAPAGRAETVETMGSSQVGVDASPAPTGRAETDETVDFVFRGRGRLFGPGREG